MSRLKMAVWRLFASSAGMELLGEDDVAPMRRGPQGAKGGVSFSFTR